MEIKKGLNLHGLISWLMWVDRSFANHRNNTEKESIVFAPRKLGMKQTKPQQLKNFTESLSPHPTSLHKDY